MATTHTADPTATAPPGLDDAGRVACVVSGGVLALLGLRRGGPVGVGLALLGGALALRGAATGPLTGRGGVLAAGMERLERALPAPRTVKVGRSVTVGRPREEVWRYVRDLRNFPRWASHVESVATSGDGRSHWTVRGPGGTRLEWDTEIENEVEGERISWQTLPGADIRNAGNLILKDAPGGRGTEVHLRLAYDAPAGALGQAIARLFGEEPDTDARHDLRRLKQLLELGETATNAMRPGDAGKERF
jgi:uncharacterized membrane protein